MDWQPIETAPKDGTTVFVNHGEQDHGWLPSNRATWGGGKWVYQFEDGTPGGIPFLQPTHWMPLHAPPSSNADESTPHEQQEQ